MHRADARAELFGGLLLLHAAQHQLDCLYFVKSVFRV